MDRFAGSGPMRGSLAGFWALIGVRDVIGELMCHNRMFSEEKDLRKSVDSSEVWRARDGSADQIQGSAD